MNSNNKVIVIAVVVAVLLVGLVWWVQTQNVNAPAMEDIQTETTGGDTTTDIQADLDAQGDINLDEEFQEIDKDLETL